MCRNTKVTHKKLNVGTEISKRLPAYLLAQESLRRNFLRTVAAYGNSVMPVTSLIEASSRLAVTGEQLFTLASLY